MNKDQALSLLKLIADLYQILQQPVPVQQVQAEPEKPSLKVDRVK